MLEMRHITKTYRSKKGNKTTALNDISLKFGDKGLVFVLGKSGSGKSTLLNVLGGLDRMDQGEIIIQGKSSKDFSNQDFDSYRNTYIGFIFQEFNILEDYNVYRNVALALQLQQKEVNPKKITDILEKLDLKGLENRKANELSGGQKQRVAIARALIKDPDIIMADEPTGALDSATGEQVLEVLKEISKEKLVIVVSHDREFANKYADRIVEFKDGNVMEDTNPHAVDTKETPFQLIRSKLPFKESFKLGLGSLNHKKIRLAFTILLTSCALMFLGLSDTLSSFQLSKAHAKLVSEGTEDTLILKKMDRYNEWTATEIPFLENDITKLNKEGMRGYPSYRLAGKHYNIAVSDLNIDIDYQTSSLYYGIELGSLGFIEVDGKSSLIEEEVTGSYPTATDEIMISNYLADFIIKYGITTEEKNELGLPLIYKPASYQELVSTKKVISIGNLKKVKIVGVVNYDLSAYQPLKDLTYEKATKKDRQLRSELYAKMGYLYNQIFVKNGFVKEVNQIENTTANGNSAYLLSFPERQDNYLSALSYLNSELSYFDGTNWKKTNTLAKNQVIINIYDLMSYAKAPDYNEKKNEYLSTHPNATEKEFFEGFVKSYFSKQLKGNLKIYDHLTFNQNKPDQNQEIEVIGVVMGEERVTYASKELIASYVYPTASVYGFLMKEDNRSKLETLFADYPYNGEYSLKSMYSSSVEELVGLSKIVKKVAFYASIVFFTFAIFLIMNFIFTSISYRKKEIGILRAIGARSIDVLKIFLWEGILIAAISGVISVIGTCLLSILLNGYITAELSLLITIFLFGIRQVFLLLITVFVIVFIASLLPIRRIAKMKPIDAILNK